MTTDTIKQLGAEFHHAADGVGEALQRLERARADRLAFLRRCSKDSTARLAAIKEEIRTLPEQIAKWDAEAARLESQTAEDLLRQALEPVQEEKPEPYRAGLPPERLRKVWEEWEDAEGDVVTFKGDRFSWSTWRQANRGALIEHFTASDRPALRPHGATWARVEAMADEAEKAAAPKMLDLRDLARGTRIEMLANATGGMGGLIRRGMILTMEGVPAAQPLVSWVADGRPYERAVCHMQPARVVKERGEDAPC